MLKGWSCCGSPKYLRGGGGGVGQFKNLLKKAFFKNYKSWHGWLKLDSKLRMTRCILVFHKDWCKRSQHPAPCWTKILGRLKLKSTSCNMMFQWGQHVASNSVRWCWADMLASFEQALTLNLQEPKRSLLIKVLIKWKFQRPCPCFCYEQKICTKRTLHHP